MNNIVKGIALSFMIALSACGEVQADDKKAKISEEMSASIDEKLVEQKGQRAYNGFAWSLYQEEEVIVAVFQRTPLENQLGGIETAIEKRMHKFTLEQAKNVVRLAKKHSPYPEVHKLIDGLPDAVQEYQNALSNKNKCKTLSSKVKDGPTPSIGEHKSILKQAERYKCEDLVFTLQVYIAAYKYDQK